VAYGLGVDLGTTFTAAAVVRDGHVEMAPLGDRSTAMPSVILMRAEGGVLTGDAANRRAASEPDRVAREVKRRLGDPTPVLLGGTPFSAGDLMAAQLREVVAQISEREGGAPSAVRLTHPANWGPYKRELFEQVPRLAGLHDVTMITEPEAAAAHYAANERIPDGSTVAVYDLGGGTFDATVLRTTGGGFEILGAPEGVEGLGGVDFDEAVFAFVDRALDGAVSGLDPTDSSATSAIVRLRQDCVLAKEALSADTEATIPVLLPSQQTEVRLTRGEFEDMIRPSVASTIASLQRALLSADVEPEQLDAVLLVGGSSRIPLVARMVSAELGRPTAVDAHPKHAIVLGAAMLVEPPSRSAGPGAPSPAHTAVFPSSGAPYRTPVPRTGPRTPSGGIPIGTGRVPPRVATGPSSGMIPAVAATRPPSTGGFPAQAPAARTSGYTPTTRSGATPSAATSVTRTAATRSTAYTPTTRTGAIAASGVSATSATRLVGPQGEAATVMHGAAAPTTSVPGAAGAPAGPPPLGNRPGGASGEPAPVGRSRRRTPLIIVGVVLVALLAGGGTFAYRAIAADAPAPAAPVPSQVVAPAPLPTTTTSAPAPAADPGAGAAAHNGSTRSSSGTAGSGGASSSGGSSSSGSGGSGWTPSTGSSGTSGSSSTSGSSTSGSSTSGSSSCCQATPESGSTGS
jgi:actin-like ATPase involved in cell morphogenesis